MLLFVTLPIFLFALVTSALQLNVRRVPRNPTTADPRALSPRATSDSLDLSTFNDMLYIAVFTLAGQNWTIQMDTGSSDLWLKGPTHPIPNANATSMTQNLTYGGGWAYGNIAWAPVVFDDISITQQAFLDTSSAQNTVLHYGTSGVMGLGFNSLSTIDAAVNKSGASNGRSLLYNLFYENTNTPNFMAFSLQRSLDPNADDVEGTFSIGEVEANYTSAVASADKIPTFPVQNPNRWNVLLEALLIGGSQAIPVTSKVDGAPADKAVILLDSGSSYTYAPTSIVNAIYGNITGAEYKADANQWLVPCEAEIDLAFQIDGKIFPVHPLDVVIKSPSAVNVCAGTFIPQDSSSFSGVVDWIAGDNFLRSVYSVYDFGDFDSNNQMGTPYVKLVSLIDPDRASAQFASQRNTTARTGIVYNAAASSSSGQTVVSLSNDLTSTLDKINTYLLPIFALMALNTLLVLGLLIGAGCWLYRRRQRRGDGAVRARKHRGRTPTPMPLEPMQVVVEEPEPRASHSTYLEPGGFGSPMSKGAYQPVSMALTEDTFVPPSPAFRYDGGGGFPKGVERPKSVA